MKYLMNILTALFLLVHLSAIAQDTLQLHLNKADSLFLKNNLTLLARKYNVDAQQALIQQAKILDNPSLYVEQNIYNSNNQKYFDMSSQGEYIFQVQQLIYTAGKRNKRIQLASLNHQLSLLEFNQLISSLIYDLHNALIEIHYTRKIKKVYDNEINELLPLVNSYQEQFEKGNVSMKELFRLRSLLLNVQSLSADLQSQLSELEKTIRIYLGINNTPFKVQLSPYDHLDLNAYPVQSLMDTALKYRPDFIWAKTNVEFMTASYRYQKALSVPDFRIGYTFDKAGNFIPNYNAFSMNIDLPVFNRNQGIIKSAYFLQKQAEMELKQKENEITNELFIAYKNVLYYKSMYEQTQKNFLKDFDAIKDGMTENFKKRNISLLEYADFFESYINAVQQYYQLLIKYHIQIEQLNYYAGKRIIK